METCVNHLNSNLEYWKKEAEAQKLKQKSEKERDALRLGSLPNVSKKGIPGKATKADKRRDLSGSPELRPEKTI